MPNKGNKPVSGTGDPEFELCALPIELIKLQKDDQYLLDRREQVIQFSFSTRDQYSYIETVVQQFRPEHLLLARQNLNLKQRQVPVCRLTMCLFLSL